MSADTPHTKPEKLGRGLSGLQRELLHHVYALTLDVENRPPDQIDPARHWVPNERSRATGNTDNTRVLWWNEGFTRSEASATSRALRRLERRGLLIRHSRTGRSTRTTQVALTAAGRELAAALVGESNG